MKFSQNLNIDTHDAFIHEEGKKNLSFACDYHVNIVSCVDFFKCAAMFLSITDDCR